MLGDITHIFQIPLRWFLAVDAKCFNFTPGHMLVVHANDQGGDVLSVDREAFDAAVREVVGETPEEAGTVKSVDGHAPDTDGAVSFELPGGKWMKTDAYGHIATADEEPIAVDPQYTPVSGTLDVVVDVKWTGTQLQKVVQEWTFVNGVLVSTGADETVVVDKPVMITWS